MNQVLVVGNVKPLNDVSLKNTKIIKTNKIDDIISYLHQSSSNCIVINTRRRERETIQLLEMILKYPEGIRIPVLLLSSDEEDEKFEAYYDKMTVIGIDEDSSKEIILYHVRQMLKKNYKYRKKIMVVDDDPAAREVIVSYLEPQYEVLFASSAEETMRLIEDVRIDLFIIDIMLPGMNGIHFCENLQQMERFQHVPMLFQTSLSDFETVKKCIRLGPVGYLVKPIKSEELTNRLDNIFPKYMDEITETTKKRVLYIDKNELSTEKLENLFDGEFEFMHLSGGIRAITIVEKEQIDYLIINMDNSAFCFPKLHQRVKSLKPKKSIKMILTSFDSRRYAEVEKTGENEMIFLRAPISKEVLVETLKFAL